jgi:hypothetical protein
VRKQFQKFGTHLFFSFSAFFRGLLFAIRASRFIGIMAAVAAKTATKSLQRSLRKEIQNVVTCAW